VFVVTDQRERVSTDPGIGPINADNTTTLRSIEAAVEVEPDGASLYYEPGPLVAVSDHRTLEMETVKLSQEIDPRRRPTELSLPRSPIPPRFDSGWPQADLVLTSSQRPAASPPRRWRVPALLFGVLLALLMLVLARSAMHRAAAQNAAASIRIEPATVPPPALKRGPVAVNAAQPVANVTPTSSAQPVASAEPASSGQPAASVKPASSALLVASAGPASSALLVASVAPTPNAGPAGSAAPVSHVSSLAVAAAHPAPAKPSPAPSASDAALSAPTAKPKRAIY
jgi:hypothetical protein